MNTPETNMLFGPQLVNSQLFYDTITIMWEAFSNEPSRWRAFSIGYKCALMDSYAILTAEQANDLSFLDDLASTLENYQF